MPRRKKEETALVPVEGQVLPALRTYPAGYDPSVLDPTLTDLVSSGRDAAAAFSKALPLLTAATELLQTKLAQVQKTDALPSPVEIELLLERTSMLSTVVERTSRTVLSMTKALDEMTRLRGFLAGGPDTRTEEITHMSDAQLMQLVLAAVGKCPKCGHRLAGKGN